MDVLNTNEFNNAQIIGIDEAQFFQDLYSFVISAEKYDKIMTSQKVVVLPTSSTG